MNLNQIKVAVRLLSLSQLKKLDRWLHELIKRAERSNHSEQAQSPDHTGLEQTLDGKTYRLESVRCGKEKCKCKSGKLHGPYWYSYARVNNKVISQYVGKRLPKDVEKKLKLRTEKRS